MGLFDKFKGKKTDEDDAVALGVATGTTTGVWSDDGGGSDAEDDEGWDANSGEGAESVVE